MAETFLNSRFIQKHDIEANWNKATNFVPKQGEIIVYDKEVLENGSSTELPAGRTVPYTYSRFKIGDGFTKVSQLEFADSEFTHSCRISGTTSSDLEKQLIAIHIGVTTEYSHQGNSLFDLSFIGLDSYGYWKIYGWGGHYGGEDLAHCVAEILRSSDVALCPHLSTYTDGSTIYCTYYITTGRYSVGEDAQVCLKESELADDRIVDFWAEYVDALPDFSQEPDGDSYYMNIYRPVSATDFGHLRGLECYETSKCFTLTGYVAEPDGAGTIGIYIDGTDGQIKSGDKALVHIVYKSTSNGQLKSRQIQDCVIKSVSSNYVVMTTSWTMPNGYTFAGMSDIAESSYDKEFNTFRIINKWNVGNREIGAYTNANGVGTRAASKGAHAEGGGSIAYGSWAHSEGNGTMAGYSAHSEGYGTWAVAENSHAEGQNTVATGGAAHAEGNGTEASGGFSHTEGTSTKATADNAHAEGASTEANAVRSHAEGLHTIAASTDQHVQGRYNIEDANDKFAHIIGNGTEYERSNAHTVDWAGNGWFAGNVTVGAAQEKLATESSVASQVSNVLNNAPNVVTVSEEDSIFTTSTDGRGGYSITGIKSTVDQSTVTKLVIPTYIGTTKVLSINKKAFKGNAYIKNVIIGDGLLDIAEEAFQACSVLESVHLPNSVTAIKRHAFNACPLLTKLNLPAGLKSLGKTVFYNSPISGAFVIPASCQTIGAEGDSSGGNIINSSNLTAIIFEGIPTFVHANAFPGCTCDVYASFSSGMVANAPWGTKGTIKYNAYANPESTSNYAVVDKVYGQDIVRRTVDGGILLPENAEPDANEAISRKFAESLLGQSGKMSAEITKQEGVNGDVLKIGITYAQNVPSLHYLRLFGPDGECLGTYKITSGSKATVSYIDASYTIELIDNPSGVLPSLGATILTEEAPGFISLQFRSISEQALGKLVGGHVQVDTLGFTELTEISAVIMPHDDENFDYYTEVSEAFVWQPPTGNVIPAIDSNGKVTYLDYSEGNWGGYIPVRTADGNIILPEDYDPAVGYNSNYAISHKHLDKIMNEYIPSVVGDDYGEYTTVSSNGTTPDTYFVELSTNVCNIIDNACPVYVACEYSYYGPLTYVSLQSPSHTPDQGEAAVAKREIYVQDSLRQCEHYATIALQTNTSISSHVIKREGVNDSINIEYSGGYIDISGQDYYNGWVLHITCLILGSKLYITVEEI